MTKNNNSLGRKKLIIFTVGVLSFQTVCLTDPGMYTYLIIHNCSRLGKQLLSFIIKQRSIKLVLFI
jgi:hypothetical protein